MNNMIPFVDLKAQHEQLKEAIQGRIQSVLEHGAYIMGPEVKELEQALASFCGAKHCISTSSGTDALLIALMALNIGPGDAVFVPSFTFVATAEVILLLGARPVFVDVDEHSFNIDPEHLLEKVEAITREGKLRPKVILAVDLFGLPAPYGELAVIAEKHELAVIADAAQSFGAALQGKRSGALAPMTATSFFPAKPLGCYGDGGALFVDDAAMAKVADSIRQHGKGQEKYDIMRVGINGRLDTLQAAILLEKLRIFPEELEARECVSRLYDAQLPDHVQRPARIDGARSAWAQYSVLVDAERRAPLMDSLKLQGIPTMIYYPRPLHLQPAYRNYGDGVGSMPVSERLCRQILSLPMHPYLTEDIVARICNAMREEVHA